MVVRGGPRRYPSNDVLARNNSQRRAPLPPTGFRPTDGYRCCVSPLGVSCGLPLRVDAADGISNVGCASTGLDSQLLVSCIHFSCGALRSACGFVSPFRRCPIPPPSRLEKEERRQLPTRSKHGCRGYTSGFNPEGRNNSSMLCMTLGSKKKHLEGEI